MTRPSARGFAKLGELGLSFDAWLYHPQLDDVVDLARSFPDQPIVVNHVGGPLGRSWYATRRDQVFTAWKASMVELARSENVCVKLGGLGMKLCGFDFDERKRSPSSADLAEAWRPFIETCIEAFGARRCMFESNFPVDKISGSYANYWNAFKRLASGASAEEKADLFTERRGASTGSSSGRPSRTASATCLPPAGGASSGTFVSSSEAARQFPTPR